MAQQWDEPTKKAPPAPVPMEERAMSVAQREAVVTAGAVAAHYAAGHVGEISYCVPCSEPVYPQRPPMFANENTPGGTP